VEGIRAWDGVIVQATPDIIALQPLADPLLAWIAANWRIRSKFVLMNVDSVS
jgi:hypothetical protein